MGWGSAISAGLQLGNTLLDSYFSREAFKDAKAWEREKLQHAHQWTVEDMRKAGLNPILSAGATNGTGGTITPHQVQSRMDGTAIMMAKEQMALMREQAKKNKLLLARLMLQRTINGFSLIWLRQMLIFKKHYCLKFKAHHNFKPYKTSLILIILGRGKFLNLLTALVL